jgi:two-component system, OmpR family, response regulator
MAKFLLVEDDEDLSFTISLSLSEESHNVVEVVNNGKDGLERILYGHYDAIILDLTLPDVDGLEICRQFRAKGGVTPLLMLTGRNSIPDRTLGLDTGADDYLPKPFSIKELSARLRALLRRAPNYRPGVLQVGNITLDPQNFQIKRNGEELQLLPVDFALLEFLMRHPGEVFSNEALLDRVWHTDKDPTAEALRSAVKRIRKKIDDVDGESLIQTVHRVGYKLRVTKPDK